MMLKELRKKNNKTQKMVADYLGIQQNTYSSIENGKRKLAVDYAKKLGEFFNVDWWIFYED